MKEEINLLPATEQTARLRHIYFYRIGQIIRRLDIILLINLLVMGVIYAGIVSLAQYTDRATMTTHSEAVDYTEQTTQANALLQFVNTQNALRQSWMPQVVQVIDRVPAGVVIHDLSVKENSNALTVQGTFNNRATLVGFESALKVLPWVASIESPLSNFATGVDTGFTLKLNRKVP